MVNLGREYDAFEEFIPYVLLMGLVVALINSVLVASTSTTIPDDFLNLYPDEVPDNIGDLGRTGFAPGPFVIGALLLVIIGIAALTGRRRRRT